MTMTYYGLHGGLQAQPGQGPALAAILLEAARLMSGAPGCRLYLVSRAMPLLAAGPEQGQQLTVLGGHGLE
jgi:hypothetical protein